MKYMLDTCGEILVELGKILHFTRLGKIILSPTTYFYYVVSTYFVGILYV